ncbi:MAG: hypothetical protein OJF51_004869 [Nitrospira sp.]|jgi:hypothetical protein|nr:MAG: hypothetical protein OJF51_004869 [Nitrospira sp.]
MQDENLWNELCRSMSWRELLNEYNEALLRIDRYTIANLEVDVPLAVREVCQRLIMLHGDVQRVASTKGMLDQPAPLEAVKVIMRVVGRVRREVPLVEHLGNA